MGIPGHVNWYECNGICEDPPRNKYFPGQGFGSRYQFPLPEVEGAPVPSVANYDPVNVAWMIEFFAGMIGMPKEQVVFRYENNTPNDPTDDIFVAHPGGEYLPDAMTCRLKKPDMVAYEAAAKKSPLLKLYMDNSPANITYFQNQCPENQF